MRKRRLFVSDLIVVIILLSIFVFLVNKTIERGPTYVIPTQLEEYVGKEMTLTQPDKKKFTARIYGDDYFRYYRSSDGTVLKMSGETGFFTKARFVLIDGVPRLDATNIIYTQDPSVINRLNNWYEADFGPITEREINEIKEYNKNNGIKSIGG